MDREALSKRWNWPPSNGSIGSTWARFVNAADIPQAPDIDITRAMMGCWRSRRSVYGLECQRDILEIKRARRAENQPKLLLMRKRRQFRQGDTIWQCPPRAGSIRSVVVLNAPPDALSSGATREPRAFGQARCDAAAEGRYVRDLHAHERTKLIPQGRPRVSGSCRTRRSRRNAPLTRGRATAS